jgi:hypothetical protein
VWTTQTTVYFEAVTGTPANELIYPSTSDSTVGPLITIASVSAPLAIAWYPNSRPIITATAGAISGTGSIAAGDILKGATSGAIIQAVNAVSASTLQQFYLIDGTPSAETFNDLNQVSGSALSALATLEMPALTLAIGQDGRIITAKGCRGTVKLTGERSKPGLPGVHLQGRLPGGRERRPGPGRHVRVQGPAALAGHGLPWSEATSRARPAALRASRRTPTCTPRVSCRSRST